MRFLIIFLVAYDCYHFRYAFAVYPTKFTARSLGRKQIVQSLTFAIQVPCYRHTLLLKYYVTIYVNMHIVGHAQRALHYGIRPDVLNFYISKSKVINNMWKI